jgi:sulfur-oxidizing protein SoxB
MISRRDLLQAAALAATATGLTGGFLGRAAAQGRLSEADLLRFPARGNVTILHVADIHAQLVPLYFREPSWNLGMGEAAGKPPHLTGAAFLKHYNLAPRTAEAYALTDQDFAELATIHGRMGGLDRVATILKAIRAERGEDRTLVLDGGDTWTNSWTSLKTNAADIVDVMNALRPDAMTGHWEFTLGAPRVEEIVKVLPFPFLAQNVRENEFEEHVFPRRAMIEKGGVTIAVIGQAYPYTPIANPRWLIPQWTFGLREDDLAKEVAEARAEGAALVVLLSHNGFDMDRKLAGRVKGIDVILTAHTHDALPEPELVGKTLLIASGSHGKFVSRLDLEVSGGEVKGYAYRLIPVFADVITPDPEVAALIGRLRAPFEPELGTVLGRTTGLLFRRGNFQGTFDDVFTDAMLEQRDAEIALSPGVRWGASLIPGQDITFEDVTNACAMSYPNCYRMEMTGARLKEVLEDVADNIFNPDPYFQGGGDMVRVGGLGFTINPTERVGRRISAMTLLRTGQPIDAGRAYTVAGWASINENTQGPPIWEVVSRHISERKVIEPRALDAVKVVGV